MATHYLKVMHKGRRENLHAVVWEEAYGKPPDGFMVDHINGDIRDNSLENLRLATRSGNAMNAKTRKDNSSGLKGLSWDSSKRKWHAYVWANGKRTSKRHSDYFEAACWVIAKRNELHGEYARS